MLIVRFLPRLPTLRFAFVCETADLFPSEIPVAKTIIQAIAPCITQEEPRLLVFFSPKEIVELKRIGRSHHVSKPGFYGFVKPGDRELYLAVEPSLKIVRSLTGITSVIIRLINHEAVRGDVNLYSTEERTGLLINAPFLSADFATPLVAVP